MTALLAAGFLLAGPGHAGASNVTITSPANGATVRGTITIATSESSDVSWINVFVDNVWVASNPSSASPPFSVTWNSTTVADGSHTVSVTGYNSSNAAIASASINISVQNHSATPTPTPTPRPTPVPSPAPTSASTFITITAPANGATVNGTITIATSESSNVSWINVYVDGGWVASNPSNSSPPYSVSWNSATEANGSHTVSVTGYNSANAAIASGSIGITVSNAAAATATASPKPTVAPTASPKPTVAASATPKPTVAPTPSPKATVSPTATPAAGSYPLSDAAAAAMVVLNPNFEPRPGNNTANHSVPSAGELALIGTLSFLNNQGNTLLGKVSGNYTGTTDEILQWASYKWGFDPNLTRANAVTETHWNQYDIGDIGNGVSLGILQIKSEDYTGTCDPVSQNGYNISFVTNPSCLSYNYTAFAADYKLAYQRACMEGSITYLASETPSSGYPTYTNATGDALLWGCIGDWYSGNWYDSGAISYIQDVQNNLSTEPWLQPGF
jgi:chloramphenicol 3-O-phosphotransferase